MGTNAPAPDNVAELLQNLKVDTQVQPISTIGSQDAALGVAGASVADASSMPPGYVGMDGGVYYQTYPASHAFYMGGYDYPVGDWDEYSRNANAESVDGQTAGGFNESGPLVYHPSGLAYNPQHVYAPYTAGAPMRGDGQLYGPHGYSFPGHMYQQSLPSNSSYAPASGPSRFESSTRSAREVSTDQTTSALVGGSSGPSGARWGYAGYPGLYGRGVLPVSTPLSGSQDVRYEGTRVSSQQSDSSKIVEGQQRHNLSSLSTPNQNVRPLAPLLPHFPASMQHRPRIAVTATEAVGRGFPPSSRLYSVAPNSGRLGVPTGFEPRGTGRQWYAYERDRAWGRGVGLLNNVSPSWDTLNEQNRGPRTSRGRYQRTTPSGTRYVRADGSTNAVVEPSFDKDQFNRSDFATSYENAKFFIIKSYSEDDIHKSIKYSAWASTVNGNRKLDAAYREAQSLSGVCPVFLFFSVNASGQFCGVAEMAGAVDFNMNLEFWQQDKWTGRIPVKWHIVKDVPNSQFRHIILVNNDNKPVTNSRDTQEVPLGQGLEMLNILKCYSLKTSILDDFPFYESRQKLMQENRARKQAHPQHQPIIHVSREPDKRPPQDATPSTSTSHDTSASKPTEGADKNQPSTIKSPEGQESGETTKGAATFEARTDETVVEQLESHEAPQPGVQERSKSLES